MLLARALFFTLAIGVLAAPLAADAQQAGKVARIGVLGGYDLFVHWFSQGLRGLGYADYKNFVLERRGWGWDTAMAPRIVAELVQMKVDVIVTEAVPFALEAQRATRTIPIVVVTGDLVGSGLAASLARPGGNVTGLSSLAPELGAKRIELLREVTPKLSRVAVLWVPFHTPEVIGLKEMESAAPALGVTLSLFGARRPAEYADALALAIKERAGAVIIFGADPHAYPPERELVRLAARHRLPALYDRREYVELGGLMSYGPSLPDLYRRAATYVDKILKGAKPADLPVEQPTRFELVINMKTAKALGLTIPQSILIRADQVIK